jgi:hypothetical protein
MSRSSDTQLPSDVCLLLRADAEQRWLHREVIPVLRQIEAHERPPGDGERLPGEELGAALAYLETAWAQAQARARQTDAVHGALCSQPPGDQPLWGHAGRYHAAVSVLRELVAGRIAPLLKADDTRDPGLPAAAAQLAEAPAAGGCAPKAA